MQNNLCIVQFNNIVVIFVSQKVQFSPHFLFTVVLEANCISFFYHCWSAIKRPTFYPGEAALFLLSLEVLLNIFHGKGLPGGGNKSQSIAFIAAQHTSHRDTCTGTFLYCSKYWRGFSGFEPRSSLLWRLRRMESHSQIMVLQ